MRRVFQPPTPARDSPIVVPADPLSLPGAGYEPDPQAPIPAPLQARLEKRPFDERERIRDTFYLLSVNNFHFAFLTAGDQAFRNALPACGAGGGVSSARTASPREDPPGTGRLANSA
jgi:hypothetical protein